MKRIHQLAQELDVDVKPLLILLRSRGFEVKSASSQIDNISADSLLEELGNPEAREALKRDTSDKSSGAKENAISTPLSIEEVKERVNSGNRFTPAEMSCEATKARVRQARIEKQEKMRAIRRPANSTGSNDIDPFNSIGARDWFAEALWSDEYPDFENNIILIGDGPFETHELRSFLQKWEISSELIGEQPEDDGSDSGYWGYSSTALPPVFVVGTDTTKAYELESLLSDKTCCEKPNSDDSPLLAYWLEQYLVDNGKSVFFRSRNLGKLKLISQEMLLAYLFSEYAIANELGPIWTDHKGSHPLLGNIDEIKLRANHSPTFSWPSTAAEIGDGSVDGDEWPDIGLLKYMGYTVGVSGESISKRREILASTYELTKLPRIGSPEYVRQWGHSQSAARLKKMADAIAAFVRNQKRKSSPSHEAISDWEIDLDWLKKNYYTGRYDYKFNWPNTRG